MARAKKIDFETSLSQLEALVDQMEEGQLTLEESLKAFETGMKLTRDCQQALKDAEQKVEVLMQQGGELVSEPLDPHALEGMGEDDEGEA